MDRKTLNLINLENKQERKEVSQAEKRILRMSSNSLANAEKKQAAWTRLHPKFILTGEIIDSPVY